MGGVRLSPERYVGTPAPIFFPRLRVACSHLGGRVARRPNGSRATRGYGSSHQVVRRRWAKLVAEGGVTCARCGKLIEPGSFWDLGHVDGSNKQLYSGAEHRACNRATAAHQKQRQQRDEGWVAKYPHQPFGARWSREWF
jgi:hypothetical protein